MGEGKETREEEKKRTEEEPPFFGLAVLPNSPEIEVLRLYTK